MTTRQVKAAIDAGATTVADVAQHTCASTGCGGCREHLESILAAHVATGDGWRERGPRVDVPVAA